MSDRCLWIYCADTCRFKGVDPANPLRPRDASYFPSPKAQLSAVSQHDISIIPIMINFVNCVISNKRGGVVTRHSLCLLTDESCGFRPALLQWPLSLRVFGHLPGAGARTCPEAGGRKASKEETAGEFASGVVSDYGNLSAGCCGGSISSREGRLGKSSEVVLVTAGYGRSGDAAPGDLGFLAAEGSADTCR
jgi:hypothetical protein